MCRYLEVIWKSMPCCFFFGKHQKKSRNLTAKQLVGSEARHGVVPARAAKYGCHQPRCQRCGCDRTKRTALR